MVPEPLGILAGTVPCPECGGDPKVRLHVANLENVLNLALPWDFKVTFPVLFGLECIACVTHPSVGCASHLQASVLHEC